MTLSATTRSDVARNVLVDLEAYSSSGQKVFQFWWDNQSFAAGQSKTLSTNWAVPSSLAAGTYTLKVGLFGAGWGPLVTWNDSAGTITVGVVDDDHIDDGRAATPATAATAAVVVGKVHDVAGRCGVADAAPSARPGCVPPREIRPENAAANANRAAAPTPTPAPTGPFSRVDGDFAGTTDEIIQWAACKWGIDEDIARAQVIKESYWYQSANGDNGESWGLGQVRDTAHQSAFQYSVNARTSSAYNLDYTYASWRACYEGVYTWFNTVERNGTYAAGDVWGCIGIWFSGRWYVNNDAYLNQTGDSVRWHYNNKTWLTTNFING